MDPNYSVTSVDRDIKAETP